MGLDCKVILETTPKPFYYPGEILNGTIIITSDSIKKVNGLKIHIRGKGTVKFTEREQSYSQSCGTNFHSHKEFGGNRCDEYVNVEYKDEETYLDATLNIFGFSGVECSIHPGRSTYPFQFILPHGLPSSMDGEHGSIVYSLEAVIGRSWAFDCRSRINFHVVGIVDLNNVPAAQLPIIVKACKTFGVIFQSGPLDVTFRLHKGGAVPGEFIPFIAEIFNKSDKTVTEYISIHQEIQYFANGKSKIERKTVAEMSGNVLKPGADHIWQENIIRVPQVSLTTLGNCRIINVKYEIQLVMKVSGIGINLTASAPFVIGNVPFRNVLYEHTHQPSYENQNLDPPPPYTEKPLTKQVDPKDDDFELI